MFADPLSGLSLSSHPLPLSRFSFHPIRRQHPIPIRPVCAGARGWGLGGRRREADKRIALSSRNDIFDQHFHTAPARGARSSRAHHPGASPRERGFSLVPLPPVLPHSLCATKESPLARSETESFPFFPALWGCRFYDFFFILVLLL